MAKTAEKDRKARVEEMREAQAAAERRRTMLVVGAAVVVVLRARGRRVQGGPRRAGREGPRDRRRRARRRLLRPGRRTTSRDGKQVHVRPADRPAERHQGRLHDRAAGVRRALRVARLPVAALLHHGRPPGDGDARPQPRARLHRRLVHLKTLRRRRSTSSRRSPTRRGACARPAASSSSAPGTTPTARSRPARRSACRTGARRPATGSCAARVSGEAIKTFVTAYPSTGRSGAERGVTPRASAAPRREAEARRARGRRP